MRHTYFFINYGILNNKLLTTFANRHNKPILQQHLIWHEKTNPYTNSVDYAKENGINIDPLQDLTDEEIAEIEKENIEK